MAKKKTIKLEIPIGEIDDEFGEAVLYSPRMLAEGKLVKMEKFTNGKYVLDRCPETKGIWLDAGEIQKARKQGFFAYLMNYFRRD